MENARRYNRWTKFILNGSALCGNLAFASRYRSALELVFDPRGWEPAGVGLISLTVSVYMLAVTFATSAVGFRSD